MRRGHTSQDVDLSPVLRVTPEVKESGVKCRLGSAGSPCQYEFGGQKSQPWRQGATSAGKPNISTILQGELEWRPWVAEARVKASEVNPLEVEWRRGPEVQEPGLSLPCRAVKEQCDESTGPQESLPRAPFSLSPDSIPRTVIRCR